MIFAFIINSSLVAVAVMIHYEMLYRLSRLMPTLIMKHRYRLLVGVFGALIAHITEIWFFAFGYYLMMRLGSDGSLGTLIGETSNDLMDCVYYSFITYTTLGFGDVIPTGSLRFLTGLESLTGLVLITWTASFLYIEMQKFWNDR